MTLQGSGGWFTAMVALAALAGCAAETTTVVALPSPAPLPAGAAADPLASLDGVVQIGEIPPGQTRALLGTVRKGSLHVVVQCDGQGVTPVEVRGIPGTFTVPCSPGGEVSYNTIVFQHNQPHAEVRIVSDGTRRVSARIGWDPSLPELPAWQNPKV